MGFAAGWDPARPGAAAPGESVWSEDVAAEKRSYTGQFLRPVLARALARLEAIDLQTIPSLGYAFQVETTYRALRAGFRVARDLAAQPAMQPFIEAEFFPGPKCQSDDEIDEQTTAIDPDREGLMRDRLLRGTRLSERGAGRIDQGAGRRRLS